ncbi:MAG: SprB repeat-containing protein [Bacteroidetes bacterium]|nr:SprB repeat-containing protein [Bacteroidota bacterium]
MKNSIITFLVIISMGISSQLKAQLPCFINNPANPNPGSYKVSVKVGGEPAINYGMGMINGLETDSFMFHKLSIGGVNSNGREKGFTNNFLNQGLIGGNLLFNGTCSADSPMTYLRINCKSDSNASTFEAMYMLTYFAKGGCLSKTVDLIPDSSVNVVTNDTFNTPGIVYNPALTYPTYMTLPGQPQPIIHSPPFRNDTTFKRILKNRYKSGNLKCKLDLSVVPNIDNLGQLNNYSDILPTLDKIVLKAPTKFPKEVYNWQYRVDDLLNASLNINDTNWRNFPDSFNHKQQVILSAWDLLGSKCMNYFDKAIYIRIAGCGPSSDVVVKNIRLSAPKVKLLQVYNTTCVNTKDGAFLTKLSRKILKHENLFVSIKRLDGGRNKIVFKDTIGYGDTLQLNKDSIYHSPKTFDAGSYEMQLYGTLDSNGVTTPTYNLCFTTFEIKRPAPVSFTTSILPVKCIGNQDGSMRIYMKGGVGKYQVKVSTPANQSIATWKNVTLKYDTTRGSFDTVLSTGFVQLDTLKSGSILINVRDSNGCEAREQLGFGAVITDSVFIGQPLDSIKVIIDTLRQPKAYGFSDGYMHIHLKGGTPNPNTGKYTFTWEDENGNPKSVSYTESLQNGQTHITAANMQGGHYVLKIKDYFYSKANPNATCALTSDIYLPQPEKLQIFFADVPPSCHFSIIQGDMANNGTMTAHVTGGVKYISGMPYVYNWQRYSVDSGWLQLNNNDSILSQIGAGLYRLNVTDANGIVVGNYSGDSLTEAVDSIHDFVGPAAIEFNPSIIGIGCNGSATGSISPGVYGGTPPYSYNWNTGNVDTSLSNLDAGKFGLTITDQNGCIVMHDFEVQGVFSLSATVTQPSCPFSNDGSIDVAIMGGDPNNYSFNWINPGGSNGTHLDNLTAGTYKVTVLDIKNIPGCQVTYQIQLKGPDLIPLNVPPTYTLCNNQILKLDVNQNNDDYTYNWVDNNGTFSTEPQAEIAKSGSYNITIYDWKNNGCIVAVAYTVVYDNFKDIDAEFLLPTHAYQGDEITLVDVSEYTVDSMRWKFPRGIQVLKTDNRYITFKSDSMGSYFINLTRNLDACIASQTKEIVITENPDPFKRQNAYVPFIKAASVYPVPIDHGSTDPINVHIELRETTNVTLKLFHIMGTNLGIVGQGNGLSTYDFSIVGSNLESGIYMLLIETMQERKVLRISVASK